MTDITFRLLTLSTCTYCISFLPLCFFPTLSTNSNTLCCTKWMGLLCWSLFSSFESYSSLTSTTSMEGMSLFFLLRSVVWAGGHQPAQLPDLKSQSEVYRAHHWHEGHWSGDSSHLFSPAIFKAIQPRKRIKVSENKIKILTFHLRVLTFFSDSDFNLRILTLFFLEFRKIIWISEVTL